MRGMNATTGTELNDLEHLKQSIRDILTTPLGSRVMRRDYGSSLFELVDAPMNRSTLAEIYAATADALDRWEPRFKLLRVQADVIAPGRIRLTLEGEYLPDGRAIALREIFI